MKLKGEGKIVKSKKKKINPLNGNIYKYVLRETLLWWEKLIVKKWKKIKFSRKKLLKNNFNSIKREQGEINGQNTKLEIVWIYTSVPLGVVITGRGVGWCEIQ